MKTLRAGLALAALAAVAAFAAWRWLSRGSDLPPPPLTFDDDSRRLARTQFLPTLDTPLQPGKNAVWCAAFPTLWKELQKRGGGPLRLQGADAAMVRRLNNTPEPDLPTGDFYRKAGRIENGTESVIIRDMARLFPGHPAPSFPGLAQTGLLAYAYLQTQIRFPLAYFDNRSPLAFNAGTGGQAPVRAFGIRAEDDDAYHELREQLDVPYDNGNTRRPEFVIDLCKTSRPNEVAVAMVRRGPTLAATYRAVQQKLRQQSPGWVGAHTRVLVPTMRWRVMHRFNGLESSVIGAGPLTGCRIDVARQDLDFRLDRNGVELKAEAELYSANAAGGPNTLANYICDRPFLLYLKRRDASEPFFVMWVDNAELLQAM